MTPRGVAATRRLSSLLSALGIATILVLAGAALSAVPDAPHEAPTHSAPHEGGAHDSPHAGAHAWSGGKGKVPTLQEMLLKRHSRHEIRIGSDAEFNPSNGVLGGSGTFEDPYVISGWMVDTIYIHDTTKAFVIRECYVRNILVLDWTGQGGYVHHNHIENLRTNRNVPRTGDPTAAVIENNEITRVQELRHFDGVLAHNRIGRPDALPLVTPKVVLNIAGLNGAGIHDNVIHGGVDMKIHGHHHADAHGGHSHNHGRPDAAQKEGHKEDHQLRHIDFRFERNTILDKGFGLRYNDLNHAGDDRTATSEDEPDLEKPHVHHTRVRIANNTVDGAALAVKVLASPDERHLAGQTAHLTIEGNKVVQRAGGDGIVLTEVRDAQVHIVGNKVTWEAGLLQPDRAGVRLWRFENATIDVLDNDFGPFAFGVYATEFAKDVTWTVAGNVGKAKHAVYWDDSVPNPPSGDAGDGHGHSHAHDHAHGDTSALAGRKTPIAAVIRS